MSAPNSIGRIRYGGGHRVVDDERDAGLVGDAGDPLDVEDVVLGVRDRLGEERLRVRPHGSTPAVEVIGVLDERDLDAQLLEGVVEQVVRAAVQAGAGHDVVAGLGDVEQGKGFSSLPGGDQQRPHATFEGGDALLDRGLGRVHDAGVDVAELLEREQVRGMVGAVEGVAGGLVDRQGTRIGGGVGALPGVDLAGLEGPGVVHLGVSSWWPRGAVAGVTWNWEFGRHRVPDPRRGVRGLAGGKTRACCVPPWAVATRSSPGAPHRGRRVAAQQARA